MKFLHALTLIFLALKLSDHIDWSWWFVITPSLIHIAVGIGFEMFKEYKRT